MTEIRIASPISCWAARQLSQAGLMIIILAGLLLPCSALATNDTILLMVESEDCAYCKKFDREIAQAYPLTEEGKKAPLRRIDIDQWPEEFAWIEQESLTPTFILVRNSKEIDRLRGYPGDEYFWFLLGEMLDKLPTAD